MTAGPPGAVRINGTLKAQNRWFGSGDVEERIRQLERNSPVYQNGSTVRVGVTDKSLLRGISMRLVIDAPAASQVRARADSGGATVRLASSGGYDIKVHSGNGRISVPEMATRGSVSRRARRRRSGVRERSRCGSPTPPP